MYKYIFILPIAIHLFQYLLDVYQLSISKYFTYFIPVISNRLPRWKPHLYEVHIEDRISVTVKIDHDPSTLKSPVIDLAPHPGFLGATFSECCPNRGSILFRVDGTKI